MSYGQKDDGIHEENENYGAELAGKLPRAKSN